MLSLNASSLTSSSSPGQVSLAGQGVPDEQGKKREIRLMKNRLDGAYTVHTNYAARSTCSLFPCEGKL